MFDQDRVALALRDRDGDDLVGKAPVLDRRRGTLVRRRRHFVHLGPADRVAGVAVGTEAHQAGIERAPETVADDGVFEFGVAVAEAAAGPVARYGAFVIDSMPPATTMSASPERDHLVGEVDRVEPRQADLVDVDGGHAHRDAGLDRGLARRNLTLPGHEHLAHDHVVDLIGFDTGAFQRLGDRETAEFGGRREDRAPDIFPIGVRAPATMREPGMWSR